MHTYENAVTLYEDKKYYPDAEEVAAVGIGSPPGFQRRRGAGAGRRYAGHQRAHHQAVASADLLHHGEDDSGETLQKV